MSERKRVLSAIQPTGDIHFGNYFGAVRNWVRLQDDYECVYGVVDYHAMTMPYQPAKLRQQTWNMVINLLAVGVKPECLFIQSLIPEHAELCWIFNCFTSYGQLTRMTQFKDKSDQNAASGGDFISAGLLDYPVLQAADIMIYKADYVPVGKDQQQHLELTRDIAQRFNAQVGKEYFVLPEPLYTQAAKILSPADPTRKMSKSLGEKHYISLFGEEKRVRKQIRSAVTDTGDTPADTMSPGVENLFNLLREAGHQTAYDQLIDTYHDGKLRYGDLKAVVADAIADLTRQFRSNRERLLEDKKQVKDQIHASSARIRERAHTTLAEVKDLVGLVNTRT